MRPGVSRVPASRLPTITVSAPAAIAFATSAGRRTPPSAISGTPVSAAAAPQSSTQVSCGTPAPATSLVVHTKPGPIPALTASAPASTKPVARAHRLADEPLVGLRAHVTRGQHAEQGSVLGGDDEPGDTAPFCFGTRFGDRGLGRDRVRVFDHIGEKALDARDLGRLALDR